MKRVLARALRDPLGTLARGTYKLLVAPLKYGRAGDYDAARYWENRFRKYGPGLRSVGDEGLDEEANARMYSEAGNRLIAVCRDAGVDFGSARVLEVGCGNGYYAGLLLECGVTDYLGLDITDVLFPNLRQRFSAYRFQQGDVTESVPQHGFDLALVIDVIEHIVTRDKFRAAMANIKASVRKGGLIIIAPVVPRGGRSLFYVRFWTAQDILAEFEGFETMAQVPFRYSGLLALRKP